MLAVLRRELKSFFYRFSSYLFLALVFFTVALLMTLYNFFYSYSRFEYVLPFFAVAFSLIVPIITVSLFSPEHREGADKFLKMLPLSVKDIVMGKFLSRVVIVAIVTVILAICPLIVGMFGRIYLSAYGAILAFFFFGISVTSIEIFVSSIFKKNIAIWCASYTLPAALIILNLFTTHVFSKDIAQTVNHFSLYGAFSTFAFGLFDIRSIILYISVSVLFLLLTLIFENRLNTADGGR